MGLTKGGGVGRDGTRNQYILANQVLDIVRDRRMDCGERLIEVSLAEQLGVSRTLVRAALKLLAQENIVRARPNQGFSLLRGWVELKGTILALPTSSDDDLYMLLIRERLAGNIPENVTQAALLDYFNVGRAVLLKALERMAEEGLVTKNRGHGWTFTPTINTADALKSSYDFRLTIEPAVFRLSTFQVDIVALNRTRSRHLWLLEQAETINATGQQLFEIDALFHETMASFGNNSFFLQAVQHQNRLRRLLEYQGYWNLRRIQSWAREHLEIIDVISANDLEVAEARMREHLQRAYRSSVNPPAHRRPKRSPAASHV